MSVDKGGDARRRHQCCPFPGEDFGTSPLHGQLAKPTRPQAQRKVVSSTALTAWRDIFRRRRNEFSLRPPYMLPLPVEKAGVIRIVAFQLAAEELEPIGGAGGGTIVTQLCSTVGAADLFFPAETM